MGSGETRNRFRLTHAFRPDPIDLLAMIYGFRLSDKVNWSVQDNRFNAFQGNRVLATSTQPDGSMARGMIREGASWTVSSTLSFEPRTPDGARFRARLGARLKLTRSDHPATRRPANRSRFKSPGRSSDPPSSRTLCRYSRGVRPS